MPVYLELFHGRKHPDQEMDDWGEQGPVLGPFSWVHTTYGCDLKLGDLDEPGESLGELSLYEHGLAFYDGYFYGDWSIFSQDTLDNDKTGNLKARLARFVSGKTELPPIDPLPNPETAEAVRAEDREVSPERLYKATVITNELFEVEIPAENEDDARSQLEGSTSFDLQDAFPTMGIDWHTGVEVADLPRAGIEREALIRIRVNQSFFRRRILSAYDFRCCVTGLTVQPLLVASHIIPWSQDPANRLNPRNGLCLNALHDKAFDRRLMWIDEDWRIRFSASLKKEAEKSIGGDNQWITQFEGRPLILPPKFQPDPALLRTHSLACAE